MHEIIARNAPFTKELWSRERGQGLLQEEGRAVQDRAGRRHPRGRGPQDLQAGRVARSLPRPAHDLDRPDRQGLQAHPVRRLLLARRRARPEAAAHLRHRLGEPSRSLPTYLKQLEEAEKRDHRKLGREMDLFHFQEEGPGVVFWHPKGWELFQSLINYMRRRQNAAGYREVNGPQILDKSMWETSGHWETVPREHVHHRHRGRARVRHQADELSRATSRSSSTGCAPIASCPIASPSSASCTATSRRVRCTG